MQPLTKQMRLELRPEKIKPARKNLCGEKCAGNHF